MVQSVIQTSFHAGEWAPALNARVDLAKYKAGAAVMRNFFVDYRGGASSRPGTRYVIQAKDSAHNVRLIPFQASPSVGYVLEFGHLYIRFHFQGAPVLEFGQVITGATQANPCVITTTIPHGFVDGDWVHIGGVLGMTQLNGRYFIIDVLSATTFSLKDLFGANVNSTAYTAYASGGTVGRVYTLSTPYTSDELSTIKFTQSVDKLFLVQANHAPNILTLIAATNWTLTELTIGSTVTMPTGLAAASTNAGTGHFGWRVTANDANGQESLPSAVVYSTVNITAGQISTIHLTWTVVSGAISYNVYRTPESAGIDPPTGVAFGYISTVTAPNCDDTFFSNSAQLPADFSISPPVGRNPLQGGSVLSASVTAGGAYTVVPGVTFAAPPSGLTATGFATLGANTPVVVGSSTSPPAGFPWVVGETVAGPNGLVFQVTATGGVGDATAVAIINAGTISGVGAGTPANPITVIGPGLPPKLIQINLTWSVISVTIDEHGRGYAVAPAITFSAGAAAATAVIDGVGSGGNPTAVGLFQQRLVLAAPVTAVQTFYMSQPGSFYNFNVSEPIKADDAITASLVSGELNAIQSMVSVPSGLLFLTSKANWLVSSGSGTGAVTPIDIAAHAHSYNGASEVPPIVANFDILFVQAKGSIIRDLTFNWATQIYSGTDISVLSSHLFYGHTITGWAWAEEPYKVVWAVRDDGAMLTLTYLKEQDLIGWAHSDTSGLFKSVTVITEGVTFGSVDAVYTVVERVVNAQTLKYIERFAERLFINGAADAWCVDAGLQYIGPPVTNFSGAEHLAGRVVTGLADGMVITPFTMPANGAFTLGVAASKVVVGLAFIAQLKTLQLDIGDPTIQGKRKGINGVTVRVQETLGLRIGKDFDTTVPMKDLVLGNVGSQTDEIVTGLVTADARTIIDPSWDVPGQYCIQQANPLPATILGVIPEIEVGDTK